MEMVVTFVFVLFILHVTGKRTMGPDMGVYGVPAICLVLWALCQVDAYTYASLNPALAFATTIMQLTWYSSNPQNVMTHYMWQYLVGASLGGIFAGVFYHQHAKLFEHCDDDESHDGHHAQIHEHEAELHKGKAYQ